MGDPFTLPHITWPKGESMTIGPKIDPDQALLDHFAGLAMQSIASDFIDDNAQDYIAPRAYEIAEAMMAERKKRMEKQCQK